MVFITEKGREQAFLARESAGRARLGDRQESQGLSQKRIRELELVEGLEREPQETAQARLGERRIARGPVPGLVQQAEHGKDLRGDSVFERGAGSGSELLRPGRLLERRNPRDQEALRVREVGEVRQISERRAVEREAPAILVEANAERALA